MKNADEMKKLGHFCTPLISPFHSISVFISYLNVRRFLPGLRVLTSNPIQRVGLVAIAAFSGCGGGGEEEGQTVMVQIPAGTYTIGQENGPVDAAPAHPVTLAAFEIDNHEVTNREFKEFLNSDQCAETVEGNPDPCVYDGAVQSNTREEYWGNSDYDDFPVINVRWDQADAYCRSVGKRLPTEAEWEVAARGNDGRLYPWGNEVPTCQLAIYEECQADTVEVESLKAGISAFGAFEMAGNVGEWVADFYNATYYSWGPTDNPQGPTNGSSRVVRGGSWYCSTEKLTATFRDQADPLLQYSDIGFRCARSL